MFESATQEHKLERKIFERDEPRLRTALLQAQFQLKSTAPAALVILIAGPDGAGKGKLLYRLYEWLDPRHLVTRAYDRPDAVEEQRPWLWRYWRDMPARGEIGVVVGTWYNKVLLDRVEGRTDEAGFAAALGRLVRFETMLAAENVMVLKLMLYLSPEQQEARLASLGKGRKSRRHVLDEWGGGKTRAKLQPFLEEMVQVTSTVEAPWTIIPAQDTHYRDYAAGRAVLGSLEHLLDRQARPAPAPVPAPISSFDRLSLLETLDLSKTISKDDYHDRLRAAQDRLAELTDSEKMAGRSIVAVFEGHDAAGKGGAIRRLVHAMDPRRVRVHPIGAPNDVERARPWLWRFWRHLPGNGKVVIFDRSWYGRVLVERVEGFATAAEWQRAYGEINEFENDIVGSGCLLFKFWLSVSKDEQLRRFKAREVTSFKQHKITDEDWRNREKWDSYALAIDEMLDRTGTVRAPWTLVAAEDKRLARVQVLETMIAGIEAADGGRKR